MTKRVAFVLALAILLALIAAMAPAVEREVDLYQWNGATWERATKGQLHRGGRMVYFEDWLGYSNTTTGVAILAGGSNPDNSNILTVQDFCWGTTLVGGGTVKLIAGINGTVVIDTAHAAQNDAATLAWREANWSITKNPTFEAYLKVSSITNCQYEVGWYDDGNDYCLIRFNPGTSAYARTAYKKNGGSEVAADTTVSGIPTSAYGLLRVDLFSNGSAKFYINGVLVRTLPAGALSDHAFKPWLYAKVTDAGHAATKTITCDWVRVTQDR